MEVESTPLGQRPELEHCHGFAICAGDDHIGFVETPLFPDDLRQPDFLVVRTSAAIPGTFRVVSTALIHAVDAERRVIRLVLTPAEAASLPEYLPLVHGKRVRR